MEASEQLAVSEGVRSCRNRGRSDGCILKGEIDIQKEFCAVMVGRCLEQVADDPWQCPKPG